MGKEDKQASHRINTNSKIMKTSFVSKKNAN